MTKAMERAAPGWEVLAPVQLQTLCIRHQPGGLEGEALDRHTRAWAATITGVVPQPGVTFPYSEFSGRRMSPRRVRWAMAARGSQAGIRSGYSKGHGGRAEMGCREL